MELEAILDTIATEPDHVACMNLLSKDGTSSKKTLLLLTCIDLRYASIIHAKMEPQFHKLYDHVCLAGAGLSPVIDFGPDRKPHWQQTFLEHVAISLSRSAFNFTSAGDGSSRLRCIPKVWASQNTTRTRTKKRMSISSKQIGYGIC